MINLGYIYKVEYIGFLSFPVKIVKKIIIKKKEKKRKKLFNSAFPLPFIDSWNIQIYVEYLLLYTRA